MQSSLGTDETKLRLTLSAKQRQTPCSVYPDFSMRYNWPVKTQDW